MDGAATKKAVQFFEDNFTMISSLESKNERGCAEKILNILKKHQRENCRKEDKNNACAANKEKVV